MNAESIRTLIINNPRTRDGYTKPVRDAVASYAQARRTEGASWAAIEAEIDVSATSMRRWMQELGLTILTGPTWDLRSSEVAPPSPMAASVPGATPRGR